jgi:two-component system, LytTR family, response regulator
MIRTLIVEDEPRSASYLQALINTWCPQLDIIGTAYDINEAQEKLISTKPELILLDIELAGETAFSLLESFRNPEFLVIFTTAYEQYVLKALRASAIDYLLKPIDSAELVQAVNRVQQQLHQRSSTQNLSLALKYIRNKPDTYTRLALPTLEGLVMVNTEDIMSVVADGNYSRFNLKDKKQIMVSRNIHAYEQLLEDLGFLRIHHSHIVQVRHIARYIKGRGGQVIMSDGTAFDVAERKKAALLVTLKMLDSKNPDFG